MKNQIKGVRAQNRHLKKEWRLHSLLGCKHDVITSRFATHSRQARAQTDGANTEQGQQHRIVGIRHELIGRQVIRASRGEELRSVRDERLAEARPIRYKMYEYRL